jgi:putative two-component system response regulator
MAIADVYDAIISPRVYKGPMTTDEAVEFIQSQSGTHFDPDVVNAFLELSGMFSFVANELTAASMDDAFGLDESFSEWLGGKFHV